MDGNRWDEIPCLESIRRSLYIPPRTFDLSLRRKYTAELDAHLHSKRLFLIYS